LGVKLKGRCVLSRYCPYKLPLATIECLANEQNLQIEKLIMKKNAKNVINQQLFSLVGIPFIEKFY